MDKNKVFQSATRLEQKGQLDRAVAEYERLVKHDPNEVRALLRIGGLYQKKGENEQAARALERAAESYANQGFFLKAVAVYKQVLKLAPTVEAHQRLADLYQQLGLLRDAMAQFQLVVAAHEKEGRTEETAAVLRKMLDLDPENALGRARLGELLISTGEEAEGRKELEKALGQLEKGGRSDDYLRVADRLLQGEAPDPEMARKVAKIYLDKGEARKALARLQVSFKAEPGSVETLALLARGFQDLGDTKKTASVYKEMARIHKEAGRKREEREAWKQVLRLAPDDPAAREALAGAAPAAVPTPPPPPVEATTAASQRIPVSETTVESTGPRVEKSAPKAAPPPPARPEDAGKLLAEFDVYLKYKLFSKAQDHLQALLALDPDSLEAQERAALLAEAMGERPAMRDALLVVVRLAQKARDEARAKQAIDKLRAEFPGDAEVEALGGGQEDDTASGMIVVDEELTGGGEVVMEVQVDEDEPLGPASALERETSTFPMIEEDSALQAAIELSALEPSEAGETFHEPLLEIDVSEPETAPVIEAEVEPEIVEPSQEPEPEPEPVVAAPPAPEPKPVVSKPKAPAAPPEAPAPAAATPPPAPAASEDPALEAELDEAAFYVQQEMWDEAEELLRALVAKAPNDPRILGLQGEMEIARAPAKQAKPAAAPKAAEAAGAPATPKAKKPAAPSRPSAKRPPPPAFAKALTVEPSTEGSFDLAEELLGDLDLTAMERDVSEAPADLQYSVEEVLEEFKKGVSQTVRPEDSETHYNLGIAYKEMGLFSEAIGAFQQAMAGSQGTQRELDCLITSGLCWLELGQPRDALKSFLAGLGAAALTAESAIALHYEIGAVYETLGEKEKALEFFGRVHRADPGYREVAAALERLQDGGDDPKDPSSVNKGKVGYV